MSGQVCPSTQHTALDSPSHSTVLDACCSEEPDLTHTFGACECVVENRGNEYVGWFESEERMAFECFK